MAKLVNLVIDNQPVQVPEGTLVVDAAKSAGIYIPVFCYHPKMEPVGMCRMCLVEIGRPLINRETGQVEREEDGTARVQFGPKLETACTIPVSEGMVVRGFTENVIRGRKDVLEFLLTSHPLDCPICDKGGECPLQNLTMDFGPGKSRFIYDEKIRLAKHFPLGELIVLDRERCIQCARCVRFQDEIVDDPVIGFSQRGRSLQIVTYSEPGFDSYFSGNTTDICPVGALTTVDFRFQARPWELNSAATICQQCPVGCNLTVNVRRENKSGGDIVIKRVMPRQNEWV
ncbi:MAG TPA: 2Fe-2S iron-sulfur cluster-binding protein, partial [Anaerolineales bacterium]